MGDVGVASGVLMLRGTAHDLVGNYRWEKTPRMPDGAMAPNRMVDGGTFATTIFSVRGDSK